MPADNEVMRQIGPHVGVWQVTAPPEDSDLVSVPVRVHADGSVPPLTYHNGPTMPNPKLVALYAGSFWGDRAKNDQFLLELMTCGYLEAARSQGTGNGSFVGSFDIPAPPSAAITDADCQAMIAASIGHNGVPQPDPSTLYMLILSDGVQVAFDAGRTQHSCPSPVFCAYHSSTAAFIYAVQPANTCHGCNQGSAQDALQMTEAHELSEAATDPRGSGWFNDQSGQEGADETAWIPLKYGPHTVQGYAAQVGGVWVNAVGPYTPVQQPKPPPPAWQPDPRTLAFYDWADRAMSWCHTAYSAAHSPADAAAVAREAAVISQQLGAWLPHLAVAAEPPTGALPTVPGQEAR